MSEHVNPTMAGILDWTSLSIVAGVLLGALPVIAAILSIIWTAIRIWETKTVQDWVKAWRCKE